VFSDRRTHAALRYGLATMRDAAGHSLNARPSYADGEIRIALPSAFLNEAQYPLVIDPYISTEFGIGSTSGSTVVAAQTTPTIACDSTNCFVAWVDARTGQSQIYGALVKQSDLSLVQAMGPMGLNCGGSWVLPRGTAQQPVVASAVSSGTYYLEYVYNYQGWGLLCGYLINDATMTMVPGLGPAWWGGAGMLSTGSVSGPASDGTNYGSGYLCEGCTWSTFRIMNGKTGLAIGGAIEVP